MLFLNKRDLFEEKIKTVDPKKWFPDYTGGCNYDAVRGLTSAPTDLTAPCARRILLLAHEPRVLIHCARARGAAQAEAYFRNAFLSRVKGDKSVYVHVTCATDTGNIQFVLNAVNMIFLAKDMAAQGI